MPEVKWGLSFRATAAVGHLPGFGLFVVVLVVVVVVPVLVVAFVVPAFVVFVVEVVGIVRVAVATA